MRSPETREALGKLGFDVVAGSPQEFSRWIRAESEKWAARDPRERRDGGLNSKSVSGRTGRVFLCRNR